MDQTSKFCPVCQKRTLWARPGTNHILHLLLTIFLCGFWLPVWLLASIRIGGWRCQTCGYKGSLASRFLAPAVCVLLFVVVLSIICRDTRRDSWAPRTDGSRTEARPAEPAQAERTAPQPKRPEVKESQPKQPETEPKVFKPETKPKVLNEGEIIEVDHISYWVRCSWWSDRLNQKALFNPPPKWRFLFVELRVRNEDTTPRNVPPFILVDTAGVEYSEHPESWAADGALAIGEALDPGDSKQGVVVFDVPERRDYRLELCERHGLEEAYVQLTPSASKEAAWDAALHREQLKTAAERARLAEEERKAKEEAAMWRTWKDSAGRTLEARFSGMAFGKVTLTKKDGTTLQVPLERLSEDDQKWIRARQKKR